MNRVIVRDNCNQVPRAPSEEETPTCMHRLCAVCFLSYFHVPQACKTHTCTPLSEGSQKESHQRHSASVSFGVHSPVTCITFMSPTFIASTFLFLKMVFPRENTQPMPLSLWYMPTVDVPLDLQFPDFHKGIKVN